MREVNIVYGSSHNKGVAFVSDGRISRWYIVKGGTVANKTYDDIEEGCDVEELEDFDCCTSKDPINSLEEFEKFLES
jgi:hypothetical protein